MEGGLWSQAAATQTSAVLPRTFAADDRGCMLVGSGRLAADLAGSWRKNCWIAIAAVLHPMMDAVGLVH